MFKRLFQRWSPAPTPAKGLALSFGEPESVLADEFADYLGVFLHQQGEYYEPPVSKRGLAQLLRANAYHGWMPTHRTRQVLRYTRSSSALAVTELEKLLLDYLVTGELYALLTFNPLGQVLKVEHLPSVYMRVRPATSSKPRFALVLPDQTITNYQADEVLHLTQPDLLQGVYGLPAYFGAIHSILLNEAATLFRRKYFRNGAHMGSIFVTTATELKPADEKAITQKIKQSKGIGNFRSMYLHLPSNRKAQEVITVIPVGDVATRDEFEKIKHTSQADIMAAWGTRQEVAGLAPDNFGSTGDIDKLVELDFWTNTYPVLQKLERFNELLTPAKRLNFLEPKTTTGGASMINP